MASDTSGSGFDDFLGFLFFLGFCFVVWFLIWGDNDNTITDQAIVSAFHLNAATACHSATGMQKYYRSPFVETSGLNEEALTERLSNSVTETVEIAARNEDVTPCEDLLMLTSCIVGENQNCPPDRDPPWYAQYTMPVLHNIKTKYSETKNKYFSSAPEPEMRGVDVLLKGLEDGSITYESMSDDELDSLVDFLEDVGGLLPDQGNHP